MATYVITENTNDDWREYRYKYRYENNAHKPAAQTEFDLRIRSRQPAVLWRWEGGESKKIATNIV